MWLFGTKIIYNMYRIDSNIFSIMTMDNQVNKNNIKMKCEICTWAWSFKMPRIQFFSFSISIFFCYAINLVFPMLFFYFCLFCCLHFYRNKFYIIMKQCAVFFLCMFKKIQSFLNSSQRMLREIVEKYNL